MKKVMVPITKAEIEAQKLREKIAELQGGKVLHTAAQKLKIEIILTERPKDMPFETYKALRRAQNKNIRNAIR